MLHDNFGSIIVTSPLDIPFMDLQVPWSEVRVQVDLEFPFLCVYPCCEDEYFRGALGMVSKRDLGVGVDSWSFGILGLAAAPFVFWSGSHVFGMLELVVVPSQFCEVWIALGGVNFEVAPVPGGTGGASRILILLFFGLLERSCGGI